MPPPSVSVLMPTLEPIEILPAGMEEEGMISLDQKEKYISDIYLEQQDDTAEEYMEDFITSEPQYQQEFLKEDVELLPEAKTSILESKTSTIDMGNDSQIQHLQIKTIFNFDF